MEVDTAGRQPIQKDIWYREEGDDHEVVEYIFWSDVEKRDDVELLSRVRQESARNTQGLVASIYIESGPQRERASCVQRCFLSDTVEHTRSAMSIAADILLLYRRHAEKGRSTEMSLLLFQWSMKS